MFRWIGVLVALGLVAWLATRQLDDAGGAAARAAEDAAEVAGVEAPAIDADATPSEVAGQVGAQVDAMLQAGKARVDAAESDSQ
ncbi:MAG: hypothetical protein MUF07_01255 [Steroidobacteraceae bacterium]|jgi:hypothetical protein|nr:hypothetical protein [Steroidobacteraceae bacterium]